MNLHEVLLLLTLTTIIYLNTPDCLKLDNKKSTNLKY